MSDWSICKVCGYAIDTPNHQLGCLDEVSLGIEFEDVEDESAFLQLLEWEGS
jgi:hypothetical protein